MTHDQSVDALFQEAVASIDAGDATTLESLLSKHPSLLRQRLESPGLWLREKVGKALESFFQRPYLLWFVAEDPVRNGTLPPSIAQVARAIIQRAKREQVESLREQVDYALQLVSWSVVARESGVQLDLLDVLIDAGASSDGGPDNALVNQNVAAAEHLLSRGARVTLASALCLERWEDAERLARAATPREKQFALVLAALRGKSNALGWLVSKGVDVNGRSEDLYSHATPLHHAVSSGSLDAVTVLVEAGAALGERDSVYNGTSLDWAEYGNRPDIVAYLRQKMGHV